MKSNKYSDLVKFGLKPKTLMTLSESEINTLHNNLIVKRHILEQSSPIKKSTTTTTYEFNPGSAGVVGNVSISNSGGKTTVTPVKEMEVSEESEKNDKNNPWAICHAKLGPKKTPKFERCVRDVKKSIKEGKNYFDVLLEKKVVSLLEKHMRPKMTKGDLLRLLEEKKMKTPIGKIGSFGVKEDKDSDTKTKEPKTKPGTKEPKAPPKPRIDPRRNPNREAQPDERPKAKKETKESTTTAPTKPKTKPGTKEPPKPRIDPRRNPNREAQPDERPKAEDAKKNIIAAIEKLLPNK
jgi:hypothetical protein